MSFQTWDTYAGKDVWPKLFGSGRRVNPNLLGLAVPMKLGSDILEHRLIDPLFNLFILGKPNMGLRLCNIFYENAAGHLVKTMCI